MRRLLALAGVVLLAMTGCAGTNPATDPADGPGPNQARDPAGDQAANVAGLPAPTTTITSGRRHEGTGVEQPPPFQIRYGGTELHLQPVAYCTNGCVDGVDEDPPSVGSPEEIFVYVPVASFDELLVGQTEVGDECTARTVDAEVTPLGAGWWEVRPRGLAGEYRVSIFARGGGDMIASIRWTTPQDRPLPDPSARLALIADHDGRPDSYGLELEVKDLPAEPTEYAAKITVTAGNGRSHTFAAIPSSELCLGEGAIYFDEPDDDARQAAALGDFPFTTTVELVLDGVTYLATATYPDDEIEGFEPSVALEFTPPLPR